MRRFALLTAFAALLAAAFSLEASGEPLAWKPAEPLLTPQRRCWACLDYAGNGKLLLFGGWDGGTTLRDSWLYDTASGSWRRLPEEKRFPALCQMGSAWIGGSKVLFFGGQDDRYVYGSLLCYDADADKWTDLTTETGPAYRAKSRLAWDGGDRVMLYGGDGGERGPLSDTWIYELGKGAWREVRTQESPGPRCDYALAHAEGGRFLLYGGTGGDVDRSDLWEFDADAGRWRRLMESADWYSEERPYSGNGASAVVHDGVLYLFGGFADALGMSSDAVWSYRIDSGLWRRILPRDASVPSPRHLQAAAVSPAGVLYVHGGVTEAGMDDSFWALDLRTGGWSPLSVSDLPGRRTGAGLFADGMGGAWLVGGAGENGLQEQRAVRFDAATGTWRSAQPAPTPESPVGYGPESGGYARLDADRILMLASPSTAAGLASFALYSISGNSWAEAASAHGAPPPLSHYALAGIGGGRVLLFGGDADSGAGAQGGTWTLDASKAAWRRLQPAHSPPPRSRPAMTELGDGRLLLFGGMDASGSPLADTWLFDPASGDWTERRPAQAPAGRWGHAMAALDAGHVVMFGGNGGGALLSDTWIYDVGRDRWSRLALAGSPAPREGHALASLGGGLLLLYAAAEGGDGNRTLDLGPLLAAEGSRAEIHVPLYMGGGHAAFTPDGRYILAESGPVFYLWDARTGKELRAFQGHESVINAVAVSPDGRLAVTAGGAIHLGSGGDDSVRLWDLATGMELQKFSGHSSNVLLAAFGKDGSRVVSADYDGVKVWDPYTGRELASYAGSPLALSPDGSFACLREEGGTALLDLATGGKKTLPAAEGVKACIGLDGSPVLAATDRGVVTVLDAAGLRSPVLMDGHKEALWSLALSPDGTCAASSDRSGRVLLWSPATGKILGERLMADGEFSGLAFSPDGSRLLVARQREPLACLSVPDLNVMAVYGSPIDVPRMARFSRDGGSFVAAYDDGTVAAWDLTSLRRSAVPAARGPAAQAVAVGPEGGALLVRRPASAAALSPSDGRTLADLPMTDGLAASVEFSPDGLLALCVDRRAVLVYDAKTWALRRRIGIPDNGVTSARFSPDSKYVLHDVSELGFGELRLVDVATGEVAMRYEGYGSPINAVDISADGRWVAAGGWGGTVAVWDRATGRPYADLRGHGDGVLAVRFSPDSRTLATGSMDRTVRLWDLAARRQTALLAGHGANVNSVEFAAGRLLSASLDGTVRVWNPSTGDWVAFVCSEGGKDWTVFTKDGYWDGSTGGGRILGMVKGLEGWNVDQFAVRTNRPDIILDRLGGADPDRRAYYASLYAKRLRKLGFVDAQGNPDPALVSARYAVPSSFIRSSRREGAFVTLDLDFSAADGDLKSYNVYVNDVPLYGASGRPLSGKSAGKSERIELSAGGNRIEASCMDGKGAESLRASIFERLEGAPRGKLYYLGFGVSSYRDASIRLGYPAKDAADLAALFSSMDGSFDGVVARTWTDDQVSRDSFREAKAVLRGASVNDTVVFFIAGHGVHDSDPEATYYYLPWAADVRDLPGTCVPFEEVEDLLQEIPMRRKLFLMDTCESGEADSAGRASVAAGLSRGVRFRGLPASRGLAVSAVPQPREFLLERDRFIGNTLLRRSGAVVLSSCTGEEYSYEDEAVRNGYFTYETVAAFRSPATDEDGDGWIGKEELYAAVLKAVSARSGGAQHPTIDRDNLYLDPALPAVR